MRKEPADPTIMHRTFKKLWYGVARNIAAKGYAAAFTKWIERWDIYIQMKGKYVEKSYEINILITLNFFIYLHRCI